MPQEVQGATEISRVEGARVYTVNLDSTTAAPDGAGQDTEEHTAPGTEPSADTDDRVAGLSEDAPVAESDAEPEPEPAGGKPVTEPTAETAQAESAAEPKCTPVT